MDSYGTFVAQDQRMSALWLLVQFVVLCAGEHSETPRPTSILLYVYKFWNIPNLKSHDQEETQSSTLSSSFLARRSIKHIYRDCRMGEYNPAPRSAHMLEKSKSAQQDTMPQRLRTIPSRQIMPVAPYLSPTPSTPWTARIIYISPRQHV